MSTVLALVPMIFLMGWRTISSPIPCVKQEIDRSEATIGDRLSYRIEILTTEEQEVIIPENQPYFSKFVVRNRTIRIHTRKGVRKTILEYELVSYDVGLDTIPEITILIKESGDTLDFKTQPFPVEIKSVAPGLTGEEDIKGLKPQIGIRFSYWYFILGFFLLLLAAGLIILLLKNRRRKISPERIEKKPPWEITLTELKRLSESEPVTREEIKLFYSKLSFILRKYYEALYEFPAVENTTTEIIGHLKRRKDFKQHLQTTRNFLSTSDLVKFAKYIPSPFNDEREICMVKEIVEKTKEKEEEKEKEEINV
ncbi:MAG: hypothetical protein E3J87_07080 [Candidatus Cloacimonadota bacterium]|nr:MAG: hypothetical protein E3J87_07080 [Candidatus Cloacimonadota bacterium]